jgi:hypothetical protein
LGFELAASSVSGLVDVVVEASSGTMSGVGIHSAGSVDEVVVSSACVVVVDGFFLPEVVVVGLPGVVVPRAVVLVVSGFSVLAWAGGSVVGSVAGGRVVVVVDRGRVVVVVGGGAAVVVVVGGGAVVVVVGGGSVVVVVVGGGGVSATRICPAMKFDWRWFSQKYVNFPAALKV